MKSESTDSTDSSSNRKGKKRLGYYGARDSPATAHGAALVPLAVPLPLIMIVISSNSSRVTMTTGTRAASGPGPEPSTRTGICHNSAWSRLVKFEDSDGLGMIRSRTRNARASRNKVDNRPLNTPSHDGARHARPQLYICACLWPHHSNTALTTCAR